MDARAHAERDAFADHIRRLSPPLWEVAPGEAWIRCRPAAGPERPARLQGWKLHVSAAPSTATDVLERALPVLFSEDAPFKVAATADLLSELNQGEHGLSQVGKFITVYPGDDEQALRLGAALREATQGLRGPRVPSDRPLCRGSLVHYRYGGFGAQYLQTPIGAVLPALREPGGALVPDERRAAFTPPAWAEDPFVGAGVAAAPAGEALIAGRYLLTATLHESPRGAIQLAVDVVAARPCILKRAGRDAMLSRDGRDARDRLRREAAVLAGLQGDRRFPALYELVEDGEDLVLAMEDLGGETLDALIARRAGEGRPLTEAEVARLGRELAEAAAALHGRGQVFRDLKASNVIASEEGLRFIDLELVHDLADPAPPLGIGTRGYLSPQQAAGAPPSCADDSYAIGALLYFLTTGADPSIAPDDRALLRRPVALLRPEASPALVAIIASCLDEEPAARPAAAALAQALRALAEGGGAEALVTLEGRGAATSSPPWSPGAGPGAAPVAAPRALDPAGARAQARRLGDTLCAVARRDERGLFWRSGHRDAAGQEAPRALGAGSAGTLLCLAELYDALREPRHGQVLAEAARWLAASAPLAAPHPGLYVGEAGVAVALLRAGQVMGDESLIKEALRRSAELAALPHASPDLYNGTAGRLRLHLALYDETGAAEERARALCAGDELLRAAQEAGPGELRWPMPEGFEGMSGAALPGYAHGAAGIADVLLDLHEATGAPRFFAAAEAAARWLGRLAAPTPLGAESRDWPYQEGGAFGWTFWCHGAAGVARFLLRAAALGVPGADDLARRAASTVTLAARAAGPTQCHGLAGNIELLLDAAQQTGEAAFADAAASRAEVLAAFASERPEGLAYCSESPTVFTPDYMLGYGGVALCLLRIAEPQRPHIMSRAGLRSPRRAR